MYININIYIYKSVFTYLYIPLLAICTSQHFVQFKNYFQSGYFYNYFKNSLLPSKISVEILTKSIGLFCVPSPNTIESFDKSLIQQVAYICSISNRL